MVITHSSRNKAQNFLWFSLVPFDLVVEYQKKAQCICQLDRAGFLMDVRCGWKRMGTEGANGRREEGEGEEGSFGIDATMW